MATTEFRSVTYDSFEWRISGLGNPFNTGYYQKAVLTRSYTGSEISNPVSVVSTIYTSSSGGYYTPWQYLSWSNEGGTYRFYGYAQALNGTYYYTDAIDVSFPTQQYPSMPTGLSITDVEWDYSENGWECRFSWNSVSGATGYHVYLNGVRQVSTSNRYYYFYGLPPNTSFYFAVEAYNGNGASTRNTISYYFGSAPVVVPINVTITSIEYLEAANQIKIAYSIDAPAGHIRSVDISIVRDDDVWHEVEVYSYPAWRTNTYTFSNDGAGRAFIRGMRYYTRVSIYSIVDSGELGIGWNQHVTYIDIPLIQDDFEWDYPKISGQNFKVTASEWISFQESINKARNLHGLSDYGFTTPNQGNNFTATIFKQAVLAIDGIYSKKGISSQVADECRNVTSGSPIYAWYFENIKQALNNS